MITWTEMEAHIKHLQEEIPELAQYSPLAIFIKAREMIEWRDIVKYTGMSANKVGAEYICRGYKIPVDLIPELPQDGLKIRNIWLGGQPQKTQTIKPVARRIPAKKGAADAVIMNIINDSVKPIGAMDIMRMTDMPETTIRTCLDRLRYNGQVKKIKVSGKVLWGIA